MQVIEIIELFRPLKGGSPWTKNKAKRGFI